MITSKPSFNFTVLNLYLKKNISLNNIKNFIINLNYISFYTLIYDPFYNNIPWIKSWFLKKKSMFPMMLDNLFLLKNKNNESYSFRRSCREGICGSCAMNINGLNTLACIKPVKKDIIKKYFIFPLPHLPLIKDLVVCMNNFYDQYKSISPYLKVEKPLHMNLKSLFLNHKKSVEIHVNYSKYENIQSHSERLLLNGLYECILCACCSTSCPSYWWNQDKYLGPAILLQSYRWIIDTRDDYIINRLHNLDNKYKLYLCHTILNCVHSCPKKLSPAKSISNIKSLIKLNAE